jgi:circadian clock protein KaiC
MDRQTAQAQKRRKRLAALAVAKCPSGLAGFDEITHGGLPRGRPTLICGGPGCGKTLFAMEFLVRGAVDHGESGVFMSFEESPKDLTENVASLAFDLRGLERSRKLAIDYVHVDRNMIVETGEYDLEALFIRLREMISRVNAKRVVIDTLEALYGGLTNTTILRSELRRLFRWLKDCGMTAVITAERGTGPLTRQGLEEYVSDCVVLLDHRVQQRTSARSLRVVKYRGSMHGTNEYPFLIDEGGISVLPITSLGLTAHGSIERVSSGVPQLDRMLGGKGYFRSSTVLLSGDAGTGKTSIAASLAAATCAAGKRCLYFAYEESVSQLTRDLRASGIDLQPHLDSGRLKIVSERPYHFGLEHHLVDIHKRVKAFEPSVVILDPLSSLASTGTFVETRSMLTRLIDFLKNRGITGCFTSAPEGEAGISALIDTWLELRPVDRRGVRRRALMILKSRGMEHSNLSGDIVLGPEGIHLQTAGEA